MPITEAQYQVAEAEALRFVASDEDNSQLMDHMNTWFLATYPDPHRSEYRGEATATVLRQAVIDAVIADNRNNKALSALRGYAQSARDTADSGSTVDNVWITLGRKDRRDFLDGYQRNIAVQAGGTGNERIPEQAPDYNVAHKLAVDARSRLYGKTDTPEVRKEILDQIGMLSSDDLIEATLAFKCLDDEAAAMASGSYKDPAVIQREIAMARMGLSE